MDPQQFIRSWSALWLWMNYLQSHLSETEIGLAYTFRKGRLDLQFLKGDTDFLLSWEKRGNQVLITSALNSTLPKRRVAVLKHIPQGSRVLNVKIHARDRLLLLELSNGNRLVFGAYPGVDNVYFYSRGSLKDSFLKQSTPPGFDDNWISSSDPLPASVPGKKISREDLILAREGLSMDWEASTIHFGSAPEKSSMNIREFVIDVLKHAQKPRQATIVSLDKTAQTVLKRWKNKARKIEAELKQAREWPELQKKLELLQIALGLGLKPLQGSIMIPAEYSPTGEISTLKMQKNDTVNTTIENTAKKIRKYQAKIDQSGTLLHQIQNDIASLEKLLSNNDEKLLLSFLQEHGEALDRSGRQQVERKPYKKYQSPHGFDILVGRSSQDNDTLTFKVAGKNDWWFHARQVRGSHVILRTGNQIPQQADIRAAAEQAARHSKAKHSGVVVVQYCQRKHLSKPKGSHPGAVLVHHELSVTVNLD